MFETVLIANRGEIACRIIATCRRLGIGTVAVYSDADRQARHVRLADSAIHIGPAAARESYLNVERVLEAARRSGAQAIHPGYGFLAEQADFARVCVEASVVFIGPSPAALEVMGDKRKAKARMQAVGIPVTPGYHADCQYPEILAEQAAEIGWPVLIKASAGGGGKGMRLVERAEDFASALQACQREALAAFGDARVLLERYITRPRHIEVQIFGDMHGHYVHLFDRDCSVQRRHQKVLEEAPAPGLSSAQREAMAAAALSAAHAVEYVGAGTVEFILGVDGQFHFMEMNTRLQVEHPVTEQVTGLDLVEWQLRVAAGQPLPLRQEQIVLRGHAIEARLYAEDALNGFLPTTGTLNTLDFPPASPHLRIETGVEAGDVISPWYDPMLAKLIVHDESRARVLTRLGQALDAVQITGVTTNREFLSRLVRDADVIAARLDTGLIARNETTLLAPLPPPSAIDWQLAALAWVLHSCPPAGHGNDPWQINDDWRVSGHASRRVELAFEGMQQRMDVRCAGNVCDISLEQAAPVTIHVQSMEDGWRVEYDGVCQHIGVIIAGEQLLLSRHGMQWTFTRIDPLHRPREADRPPGTLVAPMPGRVAALLVDPGTRVTGGTGLLVMEAMKMEHTLNAPQDGIVRAFLVREGEQVSDGTILVDFALEIDAHPAA